MNDDEPVYHRIFRAPCELVWRCLTEPAELAQFWGPIGMATQIDGIVVEPYPGGRFETLMLGEHSNYRIVATFTKVVPPERLGWVESATGMQTTSTLDDLGDDRTAVVVHQRNVPETMRTAEARTGFLTSLNKLEEHLAHTMQGDRS